MERYKTDKDTDRIVKVIWKELMKMVFHSWYSASDKGIKKSHMRFEVFAGVLLKFQVLWEVMLCCRGLVPCAGAGTMILQNLGNRSLSDTVSQYRRRESLRFQLTKIMERPTQFWDTYRLVIMRFTIMMRE